jgi:predicted nucleotidyltransferase
VSELEEIQQKAQAEGLEFLLIGGLAVIEHGFPRITTDIDLVARGKSREAWDRILQQMGYRLINEKESFHQYERPDAPTWPLDVMLVKNATYDEFAAASIAVTVMGASLHMVSLKHLLILKLHVLKQGKIHRFLDDLIDVTKLVKINRLDLQSPELRDLFLRYGNADLYEKVRRLSKSE